MEKDTKSQLLSDLTLSLAYLCSWEEKDIEGETIHRVNRSACLFQTLAWQAELSSVD